MKKYLLWDFDNTLAYRDGMWSQTIFELLQESGFNQVRLEDIHPHLTKGFPWHTPEVPHDVFFRGLRWWDYMSLYFSDVIHQLGVDKISAMALAGQVRDRYLNIERWHLFNDTIPCLEKVTGNGYVNIIVSNHVPELPDLVRSLGIEQYFSEVYTSALVGYEKPNIQIYRKVLENLDGSCDVTMIGDNYAVDVEGALRAGIKAILVCKSNIVNYSYYCKDLSEVPDMLFKLRL